MNSVSENLKRIRKQKNLTQQQMADILFVTQQTVSNWEKGKNMPTVDMLGDIAEKLDVEIDELLYVTDKNKLERLLKKYLRISITIFLLSKVIGVLSINAFIDSNITAETILENINMLIIWPIEWFVFGITAAYYLRLKGSEDFKVIPYNKQLKEILVLIPVFAVAIIWWVATFKSGMKAADFLNVIPFGFGTIILRSMYGGLGIIYGLVDEKRK